MKNSKHKLTSKFLTYLFLTLLVYACQQGTEDIVPAGPSKEEINIFNQAVVDLGLFEQPQELSQPEVLSKDDPARDTDDKSQECYTTYYKAAPGFDEMLSLDPTSDVIYPGALIKGESIPTGEYIPISAVRDSIVLSISLQNLSGKPSVKIGDPKLSTVREGVKTILEQEVTGATPAKVNFEISQVYSKQQINLAIGANYKSSNKSISSQFDFANTAYSNRYVLKFMQVYYTIDMDLPKTPAELFKKMPDMAALGSTSPVYVSTVTYGRMIIYTIESNYSKTDIDAAFQASFDSKGIEANIEGKYTSILKSSSIKALVIGGSGDLAAKTVSGPSQVYEYISQGGNYSKDSPGAPLSYKLRFIKDNAIARVVLSSEYSIRTCDVAYPVFNIQMVSIFCNGCGDGGGTGELYGSLRGSLYKGDKEVDVKGVADVTSWSYTDKNTYKIKNNATLGFKDKIAEIEVYRPDYDKDYILLTGSMHEKDVFFDDNYGSDTEKILLKNVLKNPVAPNGEYTLKFSNKVEVKFRVSRLK